jgi:hypothetical protein
MRAAPHENITDTTSPPNPKRLSLCPLRFKMLRLAKKKLLTAERAKKSRQAREENRKSFSLRP